MTTAIPKIIYTAHIVDAPLPDRVTRWRRAWREFHPEWDIEVLTLENRPPIFNHAQWAESFKLSEPAGATARLNLIRYEHLARAGGVFVDPDYLPLKPIDPLIDGVRGFCSTRQQAGQPHLLSPSVMGAVPNHPALWHCVRDLAHSVLVYRGVWDQSGPAFLSRVVREHSHFRDVVPYHWSLFEQAEADAREHGVAYAFNSTATPTEAAA